MSYDYDEWKSDERFNGKTVKSVEYLYGQDIRITFTDDTVMCITETQTAGQMTHYPEGDEDENA
jgi:hypothetical protein